MMYTSTSYNLICMLSCILHYTIAKAKEREEDQRLMAEYAAKLDREAYERDHAFAQRMAHIDKSAAQFALEGAGKIAADEEKAREALQMKELRLAIEREQAAFHRKEQEKKKNIQRKYSYYCNITFIYPYIYYNMNTIICLLCTGVYVHV